LLKHIIELSQIKNIKNIIIFNAQKHSSNQFKHLKTDRQEQKTIYLYVSDKNFQNKRDIHHNTLNEQASEKQTSENIFMNLNENITKSCMSDTLLTIEQDKKQFSIFNNAVSTIISIDHTTIITINKVSEKNTATYIVKL